MMKIRTKNFCYAAAILILAGCTKKDLKIAGNDAALSPEAKLQVNTAAVHVLKSNIFTNASSVSGMSNYHSYFAPSIVYCGVTSIIVAFAEGRITSPNDGTASNILVQRSLDNGVTWIDFHKAVGDGTSANHCWTNPTTVYDPNQGVGEGRLWLFVNYASVSTPGSKTVRIFYNDHSASATSPFTELTGQAIDNGNLSLNGVGPGSGIVLRSSSTTMIIPAENANIVSTNSGVTWSRVSMGWTNRATESTIFEGDDSKLHRNDRASSVAGTNGGLWVQGTPSTYRRNISTSATTSPSSAWTALAIDPNLTDPKCEGSVLHYSNGSIVFCNSEDTSSRFFMKVKLSTNSGTSWSSGRYLYSAGASGKGGYSSMARVDPSSFSLGLLCNTCTDPNHARDTTNHFRVDFHRIDLNWINGL